MKPFEIAEISVKNASDLKLSCYFGVEEKWFMMFI